MTPTTPAPQGTEGGGSALDALMKGGAAAVKKVASPIANALDAQRWELARVAGLGNTPDEQMTNLRKKLGIEGAYKSLPHVVQGGIDLGLQTATDPLTYETMFLGPAAKALGAGAKALSRSTALGRAAEDYFSFGGKVARKANIYGMKGEDVRNLARGAAQKASRTGSEFSQGIERRTQAAFKGLSDDEVQRVGQALNGDISVAELEPKLQAAFTKARATTALAHRVQSSIAQRAEFDRLASTLNLNPEAKATLHKAFFGGGAVPKELEDVYSSLAAHVKEAAPHRENYLPGVHRVDQENRAAMKLNPAEHFDPRLLQREELGGFTGADVRKGFESMGRNVGRQVEGKVLRETMGDLLKDDDVKALFQATLPARGTARTDAQRLLEGLKKVTAFPRAGIVSMSPRHAMNILNLLANTSGPKTVGRALQIFSHIVPAAVRGDTKAYALATRFGRDIGAASGDFLERKPFFQVAPDIAAKVGLRPVGEGLAMWSRWMNAITWAMDDAAKIARAEDLIRQGVKPLEAGGRAAHELVDYARTSPFGEHLRYIAPFGTFRAAIPGAVLGGIARNPARAAALSRATQGAFYGNEPQTPFGKLSLYAPTGDVGRGLRLFDPQRRWDYARATLGVPAKEVLNTLGLVPPAKGGNENYWTYGEKIHPFKDKHGRWHLGVGAEYLGSALPLGSALEDLSGAGLFPNQGPAKDALRQIFGVGLR